jgi:hypothetical protein
MFGKVIPTFYINLKNVKIECKPVNLNDFSEFILTVCKITLPQASGQPFFKPPHYQ